MVRKVKQIRYYKEPGTAVASSRNQPKELSIRNLISGTAFSTTIPIIQLGIQALPGTKFYLNDSITPIVIGSTGIYELNVDGYAEINSLTFERQSIQNINDNESAYLIVDYIYGAEEEV